MTSAEQTMAPLTFDLPALELVEHGVTQFADGLRDDILQEHPYTQAAVGSYLSVLEAGGKRTRGVLTLCGYEMHGGEDAIMITEAAGTIEGLHAYLLVVDDVADHSDTRRGKPTAHILLEKFLQEGAARGNVKKTAEDMAISGALVGQHKAQEVFAGLDAPAERKLSVVTAVNKHLLRTGLGQVLDMASTTGARMDTRDIISVATSKTAYYSFQMPLEAGAILAGASDRSIGLLAKYSEHTGLAFQMQDDVMGVFGDEAKMGKSAKSDLIEGKQTLLMANTMNNATMDQQVVLRAALGNPELSDDHFAECKEIIVATGALKHVSDYAATLVERAHEALGKGSAEWPDHKVAFLHKVADSVINRDK